MVANSVDTNRLYLGVDGGGSKCKAIVVDTTGVVLGTGIGGPANPFHGVEQAMTSIVDSAYLALSDANLPAKLISELVVGMGLAGVNLPSMYEAMLQWQHPFRKLFLTTDLHIACLGAHEGNDGAIMITGTGSCGYSRIDGETTIIGAHGFPHGDIGSGAWLGLQAVTKVLTSLDGLEQDSAMNQTMLKYLNCENDLQLVEMVAKKPASFFAKLAFIVFDAAEQQDPLALSIVEVGASYISNVARSLQLAPPIRMSLIGGLTPKVMAWLAADVKGWLQPPVSPPEMGAVIYAKQQIESEI
ncbi:MAG: ATPase [Psychrobium sp.]|nr:ATPase [Psychrobium sp.]